MWLFNANKFSVALTCKLARDASCRICKNLPIALNASTNSFRTLMTASLSNRYTVHTMELAYHYCFPKRCIIFWTELFHWIPDLPAKRITAFVAARKPFSWCFNVGSLVKITAAIDLNKNVFHLPVTLYHTLGTKNRRAKHRPFSLPPAGQVGSNIWRERSGIETSLANDTQTKI